MSDNESFAINDLPMDLSLSLPSASESVAPLHKKLKAPKSAVNPAWRTKAESLALTASLYEDAVSADVSSKTSKLLPRETGHDIGMGSPVPLSLEAVKIITKLRNQKVSHTPKL